MKLYHIIFSIVFIFQHIRIISSSLLEALILDDREAIAAALNTDDGQDLLNIKGSGGQTPLMHAVLGGKKNAVELLLKAGADVKIGEEAGYTPMHGAGFQGRPEIAKLLIDHGLSVYDSHEDGYIPLHRACWGMERRHTDTVRVFLEAGVDPNYRSSDGRSCIDMTRNKGTMKLLKKWKAKKNDL